MAAETREREKFGIDYEDYNNDNDDGFSGIIFIAL